MAPAGISTSWPSLRADLASQLPSRAFSSFLTASSLTSARTPRGARPNSSAAAPTSHLVRSMGTFLPGFGSLGPLVGEDAGRLAGEVRGAGLAGFADRDREVAALDLVDGQLLLALGRAVGGDDVHRVGGFDEV